MTERKKHGPLAAIALLAAAAVLLAISGTQTARAALTYFVKCQFIGLCMDWTRSGMNDDIADKYHRSVALITDLSRNPSKLF